MKDRAAVVLVQHEQVLLVWRRKQGEEYYCLPGGHIKAKRNELPAAAAVREMKEEADIDVHGVQHLGTLRNQERQEYYFLATSWEGAVAEPQFVGKEVAKATRENQYRLVWVPVQKVPALRLLPEAAKQYLPAPED